MNKQKIIRNPFTLALVIFTFVVGLAGCNLIGIDESGSNITLTPDEPVVVDPVDPDPVDPDPVDPDPVTMTVTPPDPDPVTMTMTMTVTPPDPDPVDPVVLTPIELYLQNTYSFADADLDAGITSTLYTDGAGAHLDTIGANKAHWASGDTDILGPSGFIRGHGVTVAIVDNGIDIDHEDLADNVVTLAGHDPSHIGDASAGTHIAGIIGARINDVGIVGVAPEATLLPINFDYNDIGIDAAHEIAADNNAVIINNSWSLPSQWIKIAAGSPNTIADTFGTLIPDPYIWVRVPHAYTFTNSGNVLTGVNDLDVASDYANMIKAATDEGIVIVKAQGNHGWNTQNGRPTYCSEGFFSIHKANCSDFLNILFTQLGLENSEINNLDLYGIYDADDDVIVTSTVAITMITEGENRAGAIAQAPLIDSTISSWINVIGLDNSNVIPSDGNACGATQNFCMAAPGIDIYSTLPDDSYATASGSGQAAAQIAGAAALLKGAFPNLTGGEITDILLSSAEGLGSCASETDRDTECVDDIYGHGLLDVVAAFSPTSLQISFLLPPVDPPEPVTMTMTVTPPDPVTMTMTVTPPDPVTMTMTVTPPDPDPVTMTMTVTPPDPDPVDPDPVDPVVLTPIELYLQNTYSFADADLDAGITSTLYTDGAGAHLDTIQANKAHWASGDTDILGPSGFIRGHGVTVAVIGAGMDIDHEDLADNVVTLAGHDANSDSNGGTHIAGIIGARINDVGIVGVAPEATLLPINFNYNDIGIDAAHQIAADNNAVIINNSWSLPSQWIKVAVDSSTMRRSNNDAIVGVDFIWVEIPRAYTFTSSGEVVTVFGREYQTLEEINEINVTSEYSAMVAAAKAGIVIVKTQGDNGWNSLNGRPAYCVEDVFNFSRENCSSSQFSPTQLGLEHSNITTLDIYDIYDADNGIIVTSTVVITTITEGENRAGAIAQAPLEDSTISSWINVIGLDNSNVVRRESNACGATKNFCMAAPGSGINSTNNNNDYGTASGSSRAAPQVAGAAALLKGAFPNLTGAQITEILLSSAEGLGDCADETNRDTECVDDIYGHGLLDIVAAFSPTSLQISYLLPPVDPDPVTMTMTVTPPDPDPVDPDPVTMTMTVTPPDPVDPDPVTMTMTVTPPDPDPVDPDPVTMTMTVTPPDPDPVTMTMTVTPPDPVDPDPVDPVDPVVLTPIELYLQNTYSFAEADLDAGITSADYVAEAGDHLDTIGANKAHWASGDTDILGPSGFIRGYGVTVAIVGGGMDIDHEDLADGIVTLAGHNADTNSSGGTQIAGIIGARLNGTGAVGVAPETTLLPINFHLNSRSEANQLAADNNAVIINNSWLLPTQFVKVAAHDLIRTETNAPITDQFIWVEIPHAYTYTSNGNVLTGVDDLDVATEYSEMISAAKEDIVIVKAQGNNGWNSLNGRVRYCSLSQFELAPIGPDCVEDISDQRLFMSNSIIDNLNVYGAYDNGGAITSAVAITKITEGENRTGAVENIPLIDTTISSWINVIGVDNSNVILTDGNACGATQNFCMAAPGSSIHSTNNNNNYTTGSGSSRAAPQVAGAAALLKGAFPNLTGAQITEILLSSAEGLGDCADETNRDTECVDDIYGHGLLDVVAAFSPTSLQISSLLPPPTPFELYQQSTYSFADADLDAGITSAVYTDETGAHLDTIGANKAHWASGDTDILGPSGFIRGYGVTVAIVGGGMDIDHEDLADNVVTLAGHDADTNSSGGTQIVGIIGARINGTGAVGVAPEATLLPINFNFNSIGRDAAHQLAADNNAVIINNSWLLPTQIVKVAVHDLMRTETNAPVIGDFIWVEIPHAYTYTSNGNVLTGVDDLDVATEYSEMISAAKEDIVIVKAQGNNGWNSLNGRVKYCSISQFNFGNPPGPDCVDNIFDQRLFMSDSTIGNLDVYGAYDNVAITSAVAITTITEGENRAGAVENIPLIDTTISSWINVIGVDNSNVIRTDGNACGATQNFCMAAPGNSIHSTNNNNNYTTGSGSSRAAPQVAGAAALLKGAFPNLSAAEVVDILLSSAEGLGDCASETDRKIECTDSIYGHGLLDIVAAFSPTSLQITPPVDPVDPVDQFELYQQSTYSFADADLDASFTSTVYTEGGHLDTIGAHKAHWVSGDTDILGPSGFIRGHGVTVAIVDNGMDIDHEDLADNVVTLAGHDADSNSSGGTRVAGIIGARLNATGVVGVAPEATLLPIDINGADGIGIDGAHKLAADNNAVIINNSLSSSQWIKVLVASNTLTDENGNNVAAGFSWIRVPQRYAYTNSGNVLEGLEELDIASEYPEMVAAAQAGLVIVKAQGDDGWNQANGRVNICLDFHFGQMGPNCANSTNDIDLAHSDNSDTDISNLNAAVYGIRVGGTRVTAATAFTFTGSGKNGAGAIAQAPLEDDTINSWINVIALDNSNDVRPESNGCGPTQNFCMAAPGVDIDTTNNNDGYTTVNGSSYAAAQVSGAAALLKGAFPNLTGAEVVDILLSSATGLGSCASATEDKKIECTDNVYGHGLLDIEAAFTPSSFLQISNNEVNNEVVNEAAVNSYNLQDSRIALSPAYGAAAWQNETLAIGALDSYGRVFYTHMDLANGIWVTGFDIEDNKITGRNVHSTYAAPLSRTSSPLSYLATDKMLSQSQSENQLDGSGYGIETYSGYQSRNLSLKGTIADVQLNYRNGSRSWQPKAIENFWQASFDSGEVHQVQLSRSLKLGDGNTPLIGMVYGVGDNVAQAGARVQWGIDALQLQLEGGIIRENGKALGAEYSGAFIVKDARTLYQRISGSYRMGELNLFADYATGESQATIGGIVKSWSAQTDEWSLGASYDKWQFIVSRPLAITAGEMQLSYITGYDANGNYEAGGSNLDLSSGERMNRASLLYSSDVRDGLNYIIGLDYLNNAPSQNYNGNVGIVSGALRYTF